MSVPRSLLFCLAALGLLLTVTAVPAPFTIDENNYLVTVAALRHGRLTVPGTEGLPPSPELLYFDPAAAERVVETTPVASAAPPLYSVLALPFSVLGWRGLVLLNTLALLAAVGMVFVHAGRWASSGAAAWLAAFGVGAGAYFYEYGQAVWPHMVTVALVACSAYLATRALEERPVPYAAGAGAAVAIASGVRYQNAFILVCLALGLVVLARHRVRASAAFALGALAPLALSSVLNHARLGFWNPISKGPGYVPNPTRIGVSSNGWLADTLTMAWSRIVDYTARPPLTGTIHESFLHPHPESGAYVLVTAVKKAWLQSAPWMIVPLLLLGLAWLPRRRFEGLLGPLPQRQLRLLSVVVLPTLAMFAASGVLRTDGLCFNQRYFCELVPLVTVAFAWGVEGVARHRKWLLVGALAGAALGMVALAPHHLRVERHYMLMYFPLVLAALLAVAWLLRLREAGGATGAALPVPASPEAPAAPTPRGRRGWVAIALACSAGAGLAWAMTVHLGDDLPAARIFRRSRQEYLAQLRPYIADRSAVFASGGIKDALGPLHLDLDVVIASPAVDRAATTRSLLDAFLAQGRRVFFLPNVLPTEMLDQILEGKRVRYLGAPPVLIEVAAGRAPPA